jgi:hypothetical protein
MLWHVFGYTCTCFFCNLPYFTFITSCSMPSNMLHTPQACNKSKMDITWTQNMSRHVKQKNHEAKDWMRGKKCSKVKAQLGYPLWNIKDSILGHSNSPFSSFFMWHVSHFLFFSHVKWNHFVPNFIWAFRISIFFTYESKNNKIYSMWAMFCQWPKLPINFIFWNFFTLQYGIWFLSHSYSLCTLVSKVFVERIFSQKNCLDIPYESLNFLFLGDKVVDFILGLGRNPETCSHLTCYT